VKIEDKLLVLMKKFSKANTSDIKLSTNIKDLQFDSLDLLEFQMAIDDEFKIEISIDEFLECKDAKDIAILLEKYPSQK
jgi:acyl carrier protein